MVNDKSKRSGLRERQVLTNNAISAKDREIGVAQYNQKIQSQIDEKNNKEVKVPSLYMDRKNILFKSNYSVILFSILLLLVNTIGRGFKGDWLYIIMNIVFFILFLILSRLVNPINFASDNVNYVMPKFNVVYHELQRVVGNLLTRVGKNLSVNSKSSFIMFLVVIIITSVINIFTYSSNMEALALVPFGMYVARVVAGNKFKEELKKLKLVKLLLFAILAVQLITSIFFRTPTDYTLIVILSIVNSTIIWFKNTYIYTISSI